jgi:carboxyl-terminal protease
MKEQKEQKYKKENEEKIKTNENVVKDEFTVKKDNKKRTSKTFLFISYTIIVILVTLLINNQLVIKRIEKKTGTLSIEEPVGKDEEKIIKTISRNLRAIREKLKAVYKGEIDDNKLVESAMKGYVSGIGDKYTEYYTKEEWNSIKEDVSR